MRILHIMRPSPQGRKSRPVALYALTAALALPLGFAQYAWAQGQAANGILSQLPMSGQLTSAYGTRTDPISHADHLHEGIDIAAPEGTQVHAADAGTVVYAGAQGAYGNTVEIDHGGGLKTRYAHLSRIDVHDGDAVGADQVIGASGKEGPEPHLHFEVWQNGGSENPLRAYHAQFHSDSVRKEEAATTYVSHADMQVAGRELTADQISVPVRDETPAPQTSSADGTGHLLQNGLLKGNRMQQKDDSMTAYGDAQLSVDDKVIRADRITWNPHTGAVEAHGHIVTVHPDGTTTPGAAWTSVSPQS